jgi:hypothetical protein
MKHVRKVLVPPAALTPKPGVKEKTIKAQQVRRGHKKQALRRQGWRCLYCLSPLSINKATVEHRKPLARGGCDVADNIDAACAPCNRAKGKLTKAEFERAIFNPDMKRHVWPLYLACVEIRLKRAVEKACARLAKAA